MAKKWIQKATASIKRRKTKGVCTGKNLEVKAVHQVPDDMLLLKRLEKWQEREKQLSVIKSFFS